MWLVLLSFVVKTNPEFAPLFGAISSCLHPFPVKVSRSHIQTMAAVGG